MKTSPTLTPEHLESLGHKPMSPVKAIRARCLDCCVYQPKEVALCAQTGCAAWPFRFGKSPWRKARPPSARQLAALQRHRKSLPSNDGGKSQGEAPEGENSQ